MIAERWHGVLVLLAPAVGAWVVTAVTIAAVFAWLLWQDPENRPTPTDPDNPDHEEEP